MSKKILVIDDDEDVLAIIVLVLEEKGYEVVAASNSDILANLDDIKPEILFLDNTVGGKSSGSELCEELKSDDRYKGIKVVLCSAVDNLDIISRQCNADTYLQKPFNLDDLEGLVEQLNVAPP
jgi:two-component system, OmpR family, response regulator VicR